MAVLRRGRRPVAAAAAPPAGAAASACGPAYCGPHLPGRQPHHRVSKAEGHVLGQVLGVAASPAPPHRRRRHGGGVQLLAQQQGARDGRVQLQEAVRGAGEDALVCRGAATTGGRSGHTRGGLSRQVKGMGPASRTRLQRQAGKGGHTSGRPGRRNSCSVLSSRLVLAAGGYYLQPVRRPRPATPARSATLARPPRSQSRRCLQRCRRGACRPAGRASPPAAGPGPPQARPCRHGPEGRCVEARAAGLRYCIAA